MIETHTYSILSQLEQGTINSGGKAASDVRVRGAGYFSAFTNPKKITITASGNKPVQIELLGYTSNSTDTAIFNLYWFGSGHEFDVSEYSNLKYIRIVLRFADNSVMIPADITSCDVAITYEISWYMHDGEICNEYFSETPEKAMSKPYPKALWRIEKGVNSGMPFNMLLPDIGSINVWNLKRENVIRVYDISEPQTGFKSNGLAVLSPSKCESHHDEDKWDIDIEHPLDEFGKWKHLIVNNVLKIDGQLFRIDWNEPSLSASGQIMKAHANHISHDMMDRLIAFGNFGGGTPNDFIRWADGATIPNGGGGYYGHYVFSGSSDIDKQIAGGEYINTTLLAAYIGADNSLKHMTGGELYRDNFYFSINNRMENASDNAFNLRYSLDMTAIKQTVDYSDYCTDLHCYDNWGNVVAVSYTPQMKDHIHHPITRMRQFNYAEFEGSFDRLNADCDAEWLRVSVPKVTYEAEIASLRNEPKYAEFLNLQNYRFGDKGTIYCPELDISTEQKIISVDKNELTGDIIRLKLGNLKDSFVRPNYMGSTITSGSTADDKQLRALQNQTISRNIDGAEQFIISALETRTINLMEGR